jgi:hypothetical protein
MRLTMGYFMFIISLFSFISLSLIPRTAAFQNIKSASARLAPSLNYFIPEETVSSRSISLSERITGGGKASDTMADNIRLTVEYLDGRNFEGKKIDWKKLTSQEKKVSFELKPGEVFAFHEDALEKYEGKVVKTTGANFNASQGFLNDGFLMGDGVCHLASVINWAAQDAGLFTEVPKNHNFAQIPGVPARYGVSIYFTKGNKKANAFQNLYIQNNKPYKVKFLITVNGDNLEAKVIKT